MFYSPCQACVSMQQQWVAACSFSLCLWSTSPALSDTLSCNLYFVPFCLPATIDSVWHALELGTLCMLQTLKTLWHCRAV